EDKRVLLLPATDAAGDAIAYTVSVKDSAAIAAELRNQLGLTTYVAAMGNRFGAGKKWFYDQAGWWHYMLPDGSIYRWRKKAQGLLEGRVDERYYADPRSLLVAEAGDGAPPTAATVSVNGNQLTVDPADGFVGLFQVEVVADDGLAAVTDSFAVTVTNAAPVLDIADQEMSHNEDKRVLLLPATDADGDAIAYTVSVKDSAAIAAELRGGLGLVRYLSWMDNYRGWGAKYFQDQVGSKYYMLSDGSVYRWRKKKQVAGGPLEGRVDARYYSDPQSLLTAKAGDVPTAATVSVNGNQLTVDPADGFVGPFQVEVTAADGLTTVLDSFTVMVI
ncbi:MAG: hypothetical protein QF792_08570, partial [Phycisphaerae bacterium]|nr:hypothetical protein [Phycisphaerae bacterium]